MGIQDGLPGAWVSAVLPSRTGYLWVATPDGLVRFDGVHFVVFNRGNTPGLPADGIRALHESRDGRLWVATSRGLAVGDARGRGPFARVTALRDLPIGSMDGAGDGVVWATTAEGVWRLEDGRATLLGATLGQHGESYRALRADPSGGFWLATSHGLARVDGTGRATASFTVRDGLPSDDGLLPTCAWCRKVRDDDGYWTQIEAYVTAHSEAEFSHGICPACKEKFRTGELK